MVPSPSCCRSEFSISLCTIHSRLNCSPTGGKERQGYSIHSRPSLSNPCRSTTETAPRPPRHRKSAPECPPRELQAAFFFGAKKARCGHSRISAMSARLSIRISFCVSLLRPSSGPRESSWRDRRRRSDGGSLRDEFAAAVNGRDLAPCDTIVEDHIPRIPRLKHHTKFPIIPVRRHAS